MGPSGRTVQGGEAGRDPGATLQSSKGRGEEGEHVVRARDSKKKKKKKKRGKKGGHTVSVQRNGLLHSSMEQGVVLLIVQTDTCCMFWLSYMQSLRHPTLLAPPSSLLSGTRKMRTLQNCHTAAALLILSDLSDLSDMSDWLKNRQTDTCAVLQKIKKKLMYHSPFSLVSSLHSHICKTTTQLRNV